MYWLQMLKWSVLWMSVLVKGLAWGAVVAVPDTVYVGQNSRANIDVLANDVFVGGAVVQSASVGQFSERVVLNSDGTVHYRPQADFVGEDSFVYTVEANGETTDGQVVVLVRAFSDLLTTNPDTVTMGIGQGRVIEVLANDFYLGTRAVSVAGVTEQRFDAVSFPMQEGHIFYRAAPDFVGLDRLFYTWADDLDHTARVGVSVVVDANLVVGIAVDDRTEMVANTVLRYSILSNDQLIKPAAHVTIFDAWQGETSWDAVNKLAIYTPHEGFVGDDKFVYTVTDESGDQTSAVVRVTVVPFNAPPVAVSDTIEAISGRGVVVSVLLNDKDEDGDVLRLVSVGKSEQRGDVLQNADGSVFYRSSSNFVGQDRFVYEIEDGNGNKAQSFVFVSVANDEQAPRALDDQIFVAVGDRVNIPVLDNDTFVGDTLAVVDVTVGQHSDLVVANSDQTVHYRVGAGFAGSDHFVYTIRDGQGKTASAVVRLRAEGGIAGDFDGDEQVGFGDFLMFVARFGLRNSDLNFDERMDFDGNGEIAFADFLQFIGLFGTGASGG